MVAQGKYRSSQSFNTRALSIPFFPLHVHHTPKHTMRVISTRLPVFHSCRYQLRLHKKMEEPAVFIEEGLANMSNTLEQILDVLRKSTIAEHSKDVDSNFWETYKKVSTEYDDDFLVRANDDMGIILTFLSTLLSSSECSQIQETLRMLSCCN
ncbi:hypothetical protein DFJ58DRAFT_477554 [Suillus subalutaceus]|uniref:uncharacterized protein n=1 Tax=Suillus subalutaceus TaxID=48586 RepID=UPI001B87E0AB|nr:uncharacterized protein DFJ58DRAFT_477554 [Suillus subalutaceus]KAG1847855.1 hypothetical protein DFJ58DRAFT_477554 [Suillus subalutaceus]